MVRFFLIILFLLILIIIIWGSSTDWKFIGSSSKKFGQIKEFLKSEQKNLDNKKPKNIQDSPPPNFDQIFTSQPVLPSWEATYTITSKEYNPQNTDTCGKIDYASTINDALKNDKNSNNISLITQKFIYILCDFGNGNVFSRITIDIPKLESSDECPLPQYYIRLEYIAGFDQTSDASTWKAENSSPQILMLAKIIKRDDIKCGKKYECTSPGTCEEDSFYTPTCFKNIQLYSLLLDGNGNIITHSSSPSSAGAPASTNIVFKTTIPTLFTCNFYDPLTQKYYIIPTNGSKISNWFGELNETTPSAASTDNILTCDNSKNNFTEAPAPVGDAANIDYTMYDIAIGEYGNLGGSSYLFYLSNNKDNLHGIDIKSIMTDTISNIEITNPSDDLPPSYPTRGKLKVVYLPFSYYIIIMGGLIKSSNESVVTDKCYVLSIKFEGPTGPTFIVERTFSMNYARYDFDVCVGPYGKLLWVSGGYDNKNNYILEKEWLLLENLLNNRGSFIKSPLIVELPPLIGGYITPPPYFYYDYTGIQNSLYPSPPITYKSPPDPVSTMVTNTNNSLIYFTNDIILMGFTENIDGLFCGDNLPRNLYNRHQFSLGSGKFPEPLVYDYSDISQNIDSFLFGVLPGLEDYDKQPATNQTNFQDIIPWMPPNQKESGPTPQIIETINNSFLKQSILKIGYIAPITSYWAYSKERTISDGYKSYFPLSTNISQYTLNCPKDETVVCPDKIDISEYSLYLVNTELQQGTLSQKVSPLPYNIYTNNPPPTVPPPSPFLLS